MNLFCEIFAFCARAPFARNPCPCPCPSPCPLDYVTFIVTSIVTFTVTFIGTLIVSTIPPPLSGRRSVGRPVALLALGVESLGGFLGNDWVIEAPIAAKDEAAKGHLFDLAPCL